MKTKRILGLFLALVMFMCCLSLNPIVSYANGDVSGSVKIDDENNFPDENFRNYVRRFDTDRNGKLSADELNKVTEIAINYRSVSDLKGIEYFKNLTKLDCLGNSLESLDVSKNTKLIHLNCAYNNLTSLDLSKNTELSYLDCFQNNLSRLDVSNNTQLTKLDCRYNTLKELVVSKNTELTELGCNDNDLKSLDVSNNTKLTKLLCYENELTSLDIRKNTELTELYCNNNKLTRLDVSKNAKLTNLECQENNLTSLDVSNNTSLTTLYCNNNNLTSLDVSNNPRIAYLICSNQRYNITVVKGIRKFKYSDFPEGFDKDKATSLVGASLGDDALTVNSDNTSVVTYNYKVGKNNVLMDVTLKVAYFDPDNVKSMKVTNQPSKLSYTEGDPLDLTGIVVTLTDNQGLTIDVPFADFETYKIKADPENGTALTVADHNGKAIKLTKENLTAETNALEIQPKTSAPKPQPKTPEPKTTDPKTQHDKHIDMIPQTGESASFAGLLAALGFSITGLAILRKKKMMEENNK